MADLKSRNRAAMYVYNIEHRFNKLAAGCGWKLPRDVTVESFQIWRQVQEKSAKTLNDYLDVANGLLNWMHRRGLLIANPLAAVERVNEAGRETVVRRALSDDEVTPLAVCGW